MERVRDVHSPEVLLRPDVFRFVFLSSHELFRQEEGAADLCDRDLRLRALFHICPPRHEMAVV